MLVLTEQFKNKMLSLSGYMKGGGGGSDKAAKAQADAMNRATDMQHNQWQTVMNNLNPFTPLAQQGVSQLQQLSTLQGQGDALNQFYNSQQFTDMANQARYQTLASAEAMGGLGATSTGNQLSSIAPQLGQGWLSGQMNNYQNLANVGFGALTGQANAGQTYTNNMGQILQQKAGFAAANANKPSGLQSALGGAAGGAAIGTSIMPGWGTAIGAGVGLLGSLI